MQLTSSTDTHHHISYCSTEIPNTSMSEITLAGNYLSKTSGLERSCPWGFAERVKNSAPALKCPFHVGVLGGDQPTGKRH